LQIRHTHILPQERYEATAESPEQDGWRKDRFPHLTSDFAGVF
jgi:hypothetical protein